MPKVHRLLGLPDGAVDTAKQEINFTLAVSSEQPLRFIAKIGVAEQVIAALAPMIRALRQPHSQAISAETVAEYLVQRDAHGGPVIVRLVTPHGVPHTFAIPVDAAADIAARLKTESAKPIRAGNA